MEKNTLVVALLVLVVGFGAGYFVRGSQMPPMGMHMMSGGTMMQDEKMRMGMMGMDDMMGSMMQELQGKTGDAFDQAFIDEMIVHHEGAVMMAEAALTSAKHPEVKQMAQDIISAQTREIEMMQGWRTSWYGK
jgi:uncharacterized protein (DUF305 family)